MVMHGFSTQFTLLLYGVLLAYSCLLARPCGNCELRIHPMHNGSLLRFYQRSYYALYLINGQIYRKRYFMESAWPPSSKKHQGREEEETLKLFSFKFLPSKETLDQEASASSFATPDISINNSIGPASNSREDSMAAIDTLETSALPKTSAMAEQPTTRLKTPQQTGITRGKALVFIVLLLIVVLSTVNAGFAQFIGPQGWAFVIGGSSSAGNNNVLANINNELRHNHSPTPGATAQATAHLTPQQYINLVVQNMTLDQKLGQMMIVQFLGPTYTLGISTMISQYHVGAVILYPANNNIIDKAQLKGLIQQMQSNSSIPLAVSRPGGWNGRPFDKPGWTTASRR